MRTIDLNWTEYRVYGAQIVEMLWDYQHNGEKLKWDFHIEGKGRVIFKDIEKGYKVYDGFDYIEIEDNSLEITYIEDARPDIRFIYTLAPGSSNLFRHDLDENL